MNIAQMREWASAHHSLPVRENVLALCDALEGALASCRGPRTVWVVLAERPGKRPPQVLGVTETESDAVLVAGRALAAWPVSAIVAISWGEHSVLRSPIREGA